MKNDIPAAAAWIYGRTDNRILRGRIQFFQESGGVLVKTDLSGLPAEGFFGFHIHKGEACTGTDFSDTLGHYDPTNRPHPDHAGDLPPLLSAGGRAFMTVLTNRFTVREIIGKTVVIHNMPDDFRSQPAGDSGMKIACGVIERVNNRLKIGRG